MEWVSDVCVWRWEGKLYLSEIVIVYSKYFSTSKLFTV